MCICWKKTVTSSSPVFAHQLDPLVNLFFSGGFSSQKSHDCTEVGGETNSSDAWEWVQDYPSQPLAGGVGFFHIMAIKQSIVFIFRKFLKKNVKKVIVPGAQGRIVLFESFWYTGSCVCFPTREAAFVGALGCHGSHSKTGTFGIFGFHGESNHDGLCETILSYKLWLRHLAMQHPTLSKYVKSVFAPIVKHL